MSRVVAGRGRECALSLSGLVRKRPNDAAVERRFDGLRWPDDWPSPKMAVHSMGQWMRSAQERDGVAAGDERGERLGYRDPITLTRLAGGARP